MENRGYSMTSLSLAASSVSKEFNRRSIFRDVSFRLGGGNSLAVTGRNGSGKSTLVKILCGLLTPSRGTVEFTLNGVVIDAEDIRFHVGLVSPYLQLYDEFSGRENLELLSKIRTDRTDRNGKLDEILNLVGLWERRHDYVRTYSSGMKQRLKYAFAVMHEPAFLILDEPTSNLDKEGISMVGKLVEQQKRGRVLIVATNDAEEAKWCGGRIELGGKSS